MVGVIAGLLIVGGVFAMKTTSADIESNEQTTKTISCSDCGNSCNAQRNCGLSSCGAVSGGSCGCGR